MDLNGKRCAVIVAHNDDETLWIGGTILTYPKAIWRIYYATCERLEENEVALEFFRSNGVNDIKVSYLEFIDSVNEDDLLKKIKPKFKEFLSKLNDQNFFDFIFTHNEKGEYHHKLHICVNRLVRDTFKDHSEIWEFICPGAGNVAPQPMFEENWVVPLSAKIIEIKRKIFNDSYKTQLYLWANCCDFMTYELKTGPEIFTKFRTGERCIE